jgi:hypothetical protein
MRAAIRREMEAKSSEDLERALAIALLRQGKVQVVSAKL